MNNTTEAEMKTIHTMQIHEKMKVNETTDVMRVPGGWVYTHITIKGPTTTFVPLTEEGK